MTPLDLSIIALFLLPFAVFMIAGIVVDRLDGRQRSRYYAGYGRKTTRSGSFTT